MYERHLKPNQYLEKNNLNSIQITLNGQNERKACFIFTFFFFFFFFLLFWSECSCFVLLFFPRVAAGNEVIDHMLIARQKAYRFFPIIF